MRLFLLCGEQWRSLEKGHDECRTANVILPWKHPGAADFQRRGCTELHARQGHDSCCGFCDDCDNDNAALLVRLSKQETREGDGWH